MTVVRENISGVHQMENSGGHQMENNSGLLQVKNDSGGKMTVVGFRLRMIVEMKNDSGTLQT